MLAIIYPYLFSRQFQLLHVLSNHLELLLDLLQVLIRQLGTL